jgi:hypothetical protein
MKTIFYNSKIAEFFTPLNGFKTIMLFGLVFTEESKLSRHVIEHERIHQKQYLECADIGSALALPCSLFFSWWWLWLLPPFLYYVLYIIEYLVHLIRLRVSGDAYLAISFEREAYDLMYEQGFPSTNRRIRRWFGWINYLTSQNYRTP